MMESAKTYWKDYKDLDAHSKEFMKKHWKGYAVHFSTIYFGTCAAIILTNQDAREYVKDEIKEKVSAIKAKFSKKEES